MQYIFYLFSATTRYNFVAHSILHIHETKYQTAINLKLQSNDKPVESKITKLNNIVHCQTFYVKCLRQL